MAPVGHKSETPKASFGGTHGEVETSHSPEGAKSTATASFTATTLPPDPSGKGKTAQSISDLFSFLCSEEAK